MLGYRLFVAAQPGEDPVARRLRVGHGLEGGEGLRGDDEEGLGRIEIQGGFGEVGAVDVGDEAETSCERSE